MKIQFVHDLVRADIKRLRGHLGVVMARTAGKLRGVSCPALEDVAPVKQQIRAWRSFS
jgi:DNA polymerase V